MGRRAHTSPHRTNQPASPSDRLTKQLIQHQSHIMSDPSSSTPAAPAPEVAPAAAPLPPDPKAEAIKAYRAKIVEHETAEQSLKDSKCRADHKQLRSTEAVADILPTRLDRPHLALDRTQSGCSSASLRRTTTSLRMTSRPCSRWGRSLESSSPSWTRSAVGQAQPSEGRG